VLRCRIRELEGANEELRILANLDGAYNNAESKKSGIGTDQQSDATEVICPNCDRPIPKQNFDAHIVHCERKFHRCRVCGDVINCSEKDAHMSKWTDLAWACKAAEQCDFPIIRSMRAHGAALESAVCDKTGETLLHVAARLGSSELLSVLLSIGAPPPAWLDAKFSDGQTALHVATSNGHEGVAALLLESKSNVNERNGAGDTPLLIACRAGSSSLVRRLVNCSADLSARTTLGDTAFQLAQASGRIECTFALNSSSLEPDGKGVMRLSSRNGTALPPGSSGAVANGGSAPPTAAQVALVSPMSMRVSR